MKDLLPLGTILLLKGGSKRLMICGRFQTKVDTGEMYDYSGCYYPEGIINPRELFLFNNKDIDKVFFMGFQDPDEFKFKVFANQKLQEYLEKKI